MSRKVTLLVRNAGQLVDGPLLDRPVRKLPSGVAGVVYLGAVYPLYAGDVIDLRDKPFDKQDCSGFVGAADTLRYQQPPPPSKRASSAATFIPKRWYVETNRFGHYLVFDGTQKQAADLAARLEGSPLGLIRWGESTRPADDGHHYDWFARLEASEPREHCLKQIAQFLQQPQPGVRPAAAADPASGRLSTATSPPTVASSSDASRSVTLRAERAEAEVARLTVAGDARERAYRELLDRVEQVHLQLEPIAARVRDHEAVVAARDALHVELAVAQDALRRRAAEQEAASHAAQEAARRAQQRHLALQTQLDDERAERHRLDAELRTLRAHVELQLTGAGIAAGAQQHIDRLEAELGAVLRREAEARRRNADLERLLEEEMIPREQLRQEQEQLHYAIEENTRLEKATMDAQNTANILTAEAEVLHDEISELRQELADQRRHSAGAGTQRRLDELIGQLFPHLYLGGDSLEEIEREFSDPTALLGVLKRLDLRLDVPLKATSEASVREVDIHIATGTAGCGHRGRIYTRTLADGRLWVLVHRKHDKKEQSHMIAKFASRSAPLAFAA